MNMQDKKTFTWILIEEGQLFLKKANLDDKKERTNDIIVVKNCFSFGEDMDIDILKKGENVVKETSRKKGFYLIYFD